MRAASVNPEPGSNSPSKTEDPEPVRPESSQTLRVFPTLQLSKCWFRRPPLYPFSGRTKPSVRGTCELYGSSGRLCKAGSDGLSARADAQLVEMAQKGGGIVVDPVRAGLRQLLPAVAAGEQPDPQRPRPAGRQHVPHAVADHEAVAGGEAEPLGGGQEQVRVGLGVRHLVAGDDRGPRRDVEQGEDRTSRLRVPARRD